MTYTFRRAVREPTSVLVALAGPSGSGKTVSGIRLAIGLAQSWRNGRMVMIDTEHRRGTHHAHKYDFDYVDLKPPFGVQAYQEAVFAAEAAGYGAIFIDSFSHIWNGEGGCQDVHDAALERLIRGDASKAEALDGLAWKEAKLPYKKMMGRFTQLDAHLVFGLRAEDKIRYVREGGKTKVEHVGFQPICEKGFMYDMLCSFLLSPAEPGAERRGRPDRPFKLDADHAVFFPPAQFITEASGKALGEWARGGAVGMTPATMSSANPPEGAPAAEATRGAAPANGAPPPEPDERAVLLASIDKLAEELKMSKDDRRDGWNTYLGRGVTRQKAEVSGLADLLKWMRTRAGKTEMTP